MDVNKLDEAKRLYDSIKECEKKIETIRALKQEQYVELSVNRVGQVFAHGETKNTIVGYVLIKEEERLSELRKKFSDL